MQRVSSAVCTTPSGLTRIAWAGHTWAQGARGSSQCIQSVGEEATVISPRRERTVTQLPSAIPSLLAVRSCISTQGYGACSFKKGADSETIGFEQIMKQARISPRSMAGIINVAG